MTNEFVVLLFGLAAAATAGVGAYKWYKASRVFVMPFSFENGLIAPLDPVRDAREWGAALTQTAIAQGEANQKAACWTAASVALTALTAILAAFKVAV